MSPPIHRPTTLVVAALLAREDGRILVTQRPPGTRHAGKWEFPGGKVEAGEDPRAALARECREELDCEVHVGAIYETVFHAYPALSVLLLFYVVRVVSGEPRAVEGNTLAWATPREMMAFDLLDADRALPAMFERRFPHFLPGLDS